MDVERFVAQIEANIRNFERNMNRAIAKSTQLPDEVTTDVDADISKFRRGLLRATALAQRFSAKDIVKRVRLSVINPARAYHSIKTNFTDPFNRRMGELAENIRTFGTVFGNMIKGSLIASITAVVPIIAGFTSAIMALGNSIGVVAGNLLGFVGALGVAGLGVASYGGLVASVLARYNDEAFEATEASSAFTRSLDSIKSAWNGIVDQNIDRIFMQMGQAIYGAQFALEGLTPFINDVVESMTGMTNKFKDFMKESPTMLRFYDNMSEKGSTVFESVINGLGQFGKGLVDMVNAGMPLIENVASGFENMGTKFAEWADRMAANDGFKAFTEYVNENMPKISSIFSNTFLGIIDMFAAFGANSSHVFDGLERMTEQFKNWASTLSESTAFQNFVSYIETYGPVVVSLIGNIINTIVNLGIALAPLGAAVLDVTDRVFEFMSNLLKTNPIVGQLLGWLTLLVGGFMLVVPAIIAVTTFIQGILAPVAAMIAGFAKARTEFGLFTAIGQTLMTVFSVVNIAIVAIVSSIALLVSTFIYLWQTNEQFRERVIAVWTQIQEYISLAIAAVSAFIMDVWGRLVQWWNENNELIVTHLESAWNRILTIIEVAMAIIVPIIQVAWEIIKMVIQVAMEFILGFITTAMAIMNGDWALAWSIIKETLVNVWNIIKETISNVIAILLPLIIEWVTQAYQWISDKFTQAKDFISTTWENIKTTIQQKLQQILADLIVKFTEIVTNIRNKLNEAKNEVINKFQEMVSNARTKAQEIVQAVIEKFTEVVTNIRTKLSEAVSEIVSKFSEMVSEAVSFCSELVSTIISGMSDFVSEIISGGANAVSEVVSMGSQIVSSVTGFVGDMVSAGADLIRGLINGIKNMAGAAVDAAKSVVGDAIAGAKNLLGINSPSRVFRDIGQYTSQGLAIGINKDANRAVESVTRMANDMTNAFTPELSGINAGMNAELSTLNKDIHNTIDADITSGIETQRPIVNVTVRNEGDVEMIRSAIQLEDGIDETLAF